MGGKWGEAKPTEKLLALYATLLFSDRRHSLGELARLLVCSKQTVIRLARQLESAEYAKPVKEKQGKEVFFKLQRPAPLPAASLDGESLAQLALCRDFLRRLLPKALQRQMPESLPAPAAQLSLTSRDMPPGGKVLEVPSPDKTAPGGVKLCETFAAGEAYDGSSSDT